MPAPENYDRASALSALPRRSVLAAGAWSVPVIATATAAPAFAASPCARTYDYTLDWGTPGSQFARNATGTTASASATSAGIGAQPLSVGFGSALIGAANGYVFDTTYNLSVPDGSAGAGGVAPSVTNLGGLGAGERGLCLQHTSSTAATVDASGTPDRGQKLTITFPRDVTDLSFWLVDIDGPTTGYWDRLRFNVAPTVAPANRDARISGNGFGTSPFYYLPTGTNPSAPSNNNNIGENSTGARVKVSFAGPVSSLKMEYWNSAGTGVQRVFLHDLAFKSKGC